MSESNENQIEIKESRPPSAEEEQWFEYSEKLPFKSDEHLTRFADKLLTLNTAVLAAYLAALKLGNIDLSWVLLLPIVMFLLSLLSSLYSIFPLSVRGKSSNIFEVRDSYFAAMDLRSKLISFAFIAYFIGMVLGIIFTVLLIK